MDLTYPAVGFYFQVKLGNETYSFKEVSGISAEVMTEELHEGGENRFKFRIPTHVKYENLELKRGLVAQDSELMTWITDTLEMGFSSKIKSKPVEVSLLNEEGNIIMTWNFINAWPVAWKSATLDAMKNEVLIESLSISFNYFTTKIVA